MMETIKKLWFLASLILTFAVVMGDPTGILTWIGIALRNAQGPALMVVLIFLFSGLIIETDQIRAGIKDIKATGAALGVIVIISPVFGAALAVLPLETGVTLGLFLVAVMPTTLSSGVVMTGQAGGNMAHALFVTILSNSVAIFSIPIILPLLLMFLGLDVVVSIDQKAIFIKLAFLVLLPLITGLLLKRYLFDITERQKKSLGMVNQAMVIFIVFISLSYTRDILMGKFLTFLAILPLVATFHLMLLGASFGISRLLNIGKGRREAVIFMGSQKTLPLAVMLQITCFPEHVTALLVCVIYHIIHLMIDGFLAARMKLNHP